MADDVDHANEIVAHDTAEALARHHAEQARQARIAESMKPHDPAAPRVCADCGEQLSKARLNAMPFARRCVECGAAAETHYRERAWLPR